MGRYKLCVCMCVCVCVCVCVFHRNISWLRENVSKLEVIERMQEE